MILKRGGLNFEKLSNHFRLGESIQNVFRQDA
jgi:hypothetical protein